MNAAFDLFQLFQKIFRRFAIINAYTFVFTGAFEAFEIIRFFIRLLFK